MQTGRADAGRIEPGLKPLLLPYNGYSDQLKKLDGPVAERPLVAARRPAQVSEAAAPSRRAHRVEFFRGC